MTQPKHVLFGTGAPKPIADVVDVALSSYLPPDDWTQVLDLRNDPDQQVVRRLTLWAYWNVNPDNDPAPPDNAAAIVAVIDDTITTGVQVATERLTGYAFFDGTNTMPVKVLDDYPIRGPVRVIAGGDVGVVGDGTDFDNPNFIVLYGYYTIAGEEGSRAMCERRPFQLGNVVPVDGAFSSFPTVAQPNVQETTDEYVDEISLSLLQLFGEGDHAWLIFGDKNNPSFTADPRFLYFNSSGFGAATGATEILDGIPMREVGLISGEPEEVGIYTGYFIRY